MNATEFATIVALVLNAGALAVVAYQTWLTGQSLRATNRSLQLSIKTMQVEMLPNANWVIAVRVNLERWIADLQKIVATSHAALERRDRDLMKELAGGGLRSPKGLVRKYDAEHMPDWLSTIWFAGAQCWFPIIRNHRSS